MVDLKKLQIQLDDNHEHQTALSQTILEAVDQIVEENKQQGEDLANNTKAIKLMEVDMEALRRKMDKLENVIANAAEAGANNAVKESLPKAVTKGITNMMEPVKRKYTLRNRFKRLMFWKR